MSKLLLNYTVRGECKDVLMDRVLQEYRKFMDDPEVELPQNTVIQVSQETEILASASRQERVLTIWEADVQISHPYSKD